MIQLSTIESSVEATNQIARLLTQKRNEQSTVGNKTIIGNRLNELWDTIHDYLDHHSVAAVLPETQPKEDSEFRLTETDLNLLDSLIKNDRPADAPALPEDHPYLLLQQTKAFMEKEKKGIKDDALAQTLNTKWFGFMSNLLAEIQKEDPKNIKILSESYNLELPELEKFFAEHLQSGEPIDPSISLTQLTQALKTCYDNKSDETTLSTQSLVFLATYGDYHVNLPTNFIALCKQNIANFASEEGAKDWKKIMDSPRVKANDKVQLLKTFLSNKEFSTNLGKVLLEGGIDPKDKDLLFSLMFSEMKCDWLTRLEFIDAINKSTDNFITDDMKTAHTTIDMGVTFTEHPKEGIALLSESKFDALLSENINQPFFAGLMTEMSKYLNDSAQPIEDRVKLFSHTFQGLCVQIMAADKGSKGKYDTVFASYLEFIEAHWQQKEVTEALDQWGHLFANHLHSIRPAFINERIADNMLADSVRQSFKDKGLANFYSELAVPLTSVSLTKVGSKNKKEKLNNILPALHKKDLQNFSQMIPESLSSNIKIKYEAPNKNDVLGNVIYNQKGYDADITLPKDRIHQLGKPLALDDGTPIGYNVHLPKGEVKGVFVEAYGGYTEKDRVEKMYRPGGLSDQNLALLSKGYAVVTLNLVDYLKLNVFQLQMPEGIHTTLHDSIHAFHETIKNNPEKLHPKLSGLKDLPTCLFGASFGGRTAVRHAELHPHTFDRYISFDGALSFEMLKKSDLLMTAEGERVDLKTAAWLDPSKAADRIKDSVLIWCNKDDDNVNAKVGLNFYKNAVEADKQNFIRFHMGEKGNPVIKSDLANTGHFPPEDEENFKVFIETVETFLEKGSPGLPALHEWRALKQNILANKNYRSADLKQLFVSEAYRIYQADNQPDAAKLNDQAWKTHYEPLYYTLHHLDTLKGNPDKCLEDIKNLKDANLLTEEAITRGLESHLQTFLTFIIEKEKFKIPPKDLDINSLAKDPTLRQEYVRALEDRATTHFMLSTLYKANPELLKPMVSQFEKDPQVQADLQKARHKLNDKVDKEKKAIINVWQQAVKKIQQKVQPAHDKRLLWQRAIKDAQDSDKTPFKQQQDSSVMQENAKNAPNVSSEGAEQKEEKKKSPKN